MSPLIPEEIIKILIKIKTADEIRKIRQSSQFKQEYGFSSYWKESYWKESYWKESYWKESYWKESYWKEAKEYLKDNLSESGWNRVKRDWGDAIKYLDEHPWEFNQWNKLLNNYGLNNYGRSAGEDLEIWKHYASYGGEDKNRMVTIATSLLGGSAVILWYILTKQVNFNDGNLVLREAGISLGVAILGAGVSFLAGYVSLLYGGYSNRNWEKANQIAFNRGWYDLLPKTSNPNCSEKISPTFLLLRFTLIGILIALAPSLIFTLIALPLIITLIALPLIFILIAIVISFLVSESNEQLNAIAKELARPCEPKKTLAPVFHWFLQFSIILFFLHLFFVFQSVASLKEAC